MTESSTKEAVVEPYAEIEDTCGNFVRVGDKIAYAVRDGSTAAIRVGTVIEIVREHEKVHKYWTNEVPTKLRVKVSETSSYRAPEKPVLIEAGLKRFVKVV